MEKDIRIGIEELYLLRGFFDGNRYLKEEDIKSYFKMKSHRPDVANYRPGSELWVKAKQLDEEIAALPDINIKDTYADLTIKGYSRELNFSIMEYTTTTEVYCEYSDTYETVNVTAKFLTTNSHWGGTYIQSIEALVSEYSIVHAILDEQRYQMENKWREDLQNFVPSFWMLLPEVMETLDSMGTVELYTRYNSVEGNCIVLTIKGVEKVYTQVEMDKIAKAYKERVTLYDERDRAISVYGERDYIEAYRQHPPEAL